MQIPPIINPLSKDYNCLAQFKTDLSKRQKTAAIAAAIFASILPVFGTTAAFRKVVMHYSTKDLGQKQAELKAEWLTSEKVKIAEMTLPKETFTLFDKLGALGIGPADIRFQNIWFKHYFFSCANNLFGPEGVFQESDQALFEQNPKENLILYFPDEVTIERCRNTCAKETENHTFLTTDQAFYDEPLPEEFIRLLKKS